MRFFRGYPGARAYACAYELTRRQAQCSPGRPRDVEFENRTLMLPCILPAAESPGGHQGGSLHAQYSGGGAERSNGVLHQWHGGPGRQAAAGVHVVIGGPWGRDAGALHGHYHWPHWMWAFLCMYVKSVE